MLGAEPYKSMFIKTIQIIRDLEDSTPCRLDHEGQCQEHGWFNTDRECPQKRIKKILKR